MAPRSMVDQLPAAAYSLISMPPERLIFLYVFGLLGALGLLALWNEHRRRGFETLHSDDKVFRCERCAMVYTDDPDVDRSRCPQCGRTNDPFQY